MTPGLGFNPSKLINPDVEAGIITNIILTCTWGTFCQNHTKNLGPEYW